MKKNNDEPKVSDDFLFRNYFICSFYINCEKYCRFLLKVLLFQKLDILQRPKLFLKFTTLNYFATY